MNIISKNGVVFVNGNKVTNPELLGLHLLDLAEENNFEIKIGKPLGVLV